MMYTIRHCLLSVVALVKLGFHISFSLDNVIFSLNNSVYGFASICDGLFSAKIEYVSSSSSCCEISYNVNDLCQKLCYGMLD